MKMCLRRLAVLLVGFFLCLTGCGNADEFELPGQSGDETAIPAYDPSTATATVSGRILFEGTPPEVAFLDMGGDFYCQRAGIGLVSEEVLISDDGGLRNVIVYVRSGHDTSLEYPIPSQPAVLDQERCVYIPRVLTLMAGQELLIRNSDSTTHNVHAEEGASTIFNFGQRSGPTEDVEIFSDPAMPLHIGCDLHRWMDTYLGVFDHPFHTVSDPTGAFSVALPPGTYELAAWHERYGEQVVQVELGDGESASVDFMFQDTGDL